jgi:hypothetical protein
MGAGWEGANQVLAPSRFLEKKKLKLEKYLCKSKGKVAPVFN